MNRRFARAIVFWTSLAPTLAFAVTFGERSARADDSVAESLYQEGRRAVQAQDWALACTKFRESLVRESAAGTLLNLADCEENRGTLLEAFSHFQIATALLRPGDDRSAYAKQRVMALEKRIPKLTLRLPAGSPPGTVVERDGVALGSTLVSVAQVEPGEHTIVVRAPGHTDMRATIRLAEGEARDLVLPTLTLEEATTSAPSAATAAPASAPLRVPGFIGLGVGALGIGVGVAAGLVTLSAKSTVDTNCTSAGCNEAGLDAQSRGKTWSTVSTAAFIAGGVGLAAGVGLLIFGPGRRTTGAISARPILGGAELGWIGAF